MTQYISDLLVQLLETLIDEWVVNDTLSDALWDGFKTDALEAARDFIKEHGCPSPKVRAFYRHLHSCDHFVPDLDWETFRKTWSPT